VQAARSGVGRELDEFVGRAEKNPRLLDDRSDERTVGQQAEGLEKRVQASPAWSTEEVRASLPSARRLRDRLLEHRPQFEVVLLLRTWATKMAAGVLDAMAHRAERSTETLSGMNEILSKEDLTDEDIARLAAGTQKLRSGGIGQVDDLPTKELQELRTSVAALLVAGTNIGYYDDPRVRRAAWEALRAEQKSGLDLSPAVPQLTQNLEIEEEAPVREFGTTVLAELKQ
jgi:hypothetical protein